MSCASGFGSSPLSSPSGSPDRPVHHASAESLSGAASVIIDPQPPQVFGSSVQEVVQLGTGGYWSNQDYYNTQVEILRSYDLAELTVRRYDLQHNQKLVPRKPNDTRSEEELIADASAALAGCWTLLRIETVASCASSSRITTRTSPSTWPTSTSTRFWNTHAGCAAKGSSSVGEYLSGELDRAEKSLRDTEEALSKFKEKNDILSVSLEDKQNMLAADLERYTTAHSEAKIKRLELEAVRERLAKLKDEDVASSPVFGLTQSESTVQPIKAQLAEEKQKLAELREEFGPKHPVYLNQLQKTAELEQVLKTEAQRVTREIEEEYQATLAKERRYDAEIERLKQEAFELGPKAIEYKRYNRKYKHAEDNYNLVLSRLQTNDISSRNREINVRPHTAARSARLVSPRLKLNIALAFLMSLHRRYCAGVRTGAARPYCKGRRCPRERCRGTAIGRHSDRGGSRATRRLLACRGSRPVRVSQSQVSRRGVLPVDSHEYLVQHRRSSAEDNGRVEPPPQRWQDDHSRVPGHDDGAERSARAPRRYRLATTAPAQIAGCRTDARSYQHDPRGILVGGVGQEH